jgi:hypothetical protein
MICPKCHRKRAETEREWIGDSRLCWIGSNAGKGMCTLAELAHLRQSIAGMQTIRRKLQAGGISAQQRNALINRLVELVP